MVKALHCPACGGSLDPEARACPHCGTTVATRRCGICFDLNLAGDSNCRRCGARLPEEDPAARAQRLVCACCGAAMTPRRLVNSSFDECDHCGGLWLAPSTAAGVATQAQTRAWLRPFDPPSAPIASSPQPQEVTYRKCPVCGKLMNRPQYASGSGVIVDTCKEHGTHFDSGELTRIFGFIESGGLEKARKREAEALREDLRDLRRKAITIGGADAPSPIELASASRPATALDLIRWIADLWSSRA